ncbi:MAG: hypothetical protein QM723_11380 [Myxococcaceae bacterium]
MRLEFQPLDKAFFAGTRAPWASFAPVWRLEYRGPLTREQLERALAWTLARYPSCHARVVALDGDFEKARRFAWEIPDPLPAPALVVAENDSGLFDRFIDLQREAPFLCTWVPSATGGTIALQQHHSLADGRAFLALISDLVRCLGASTSPLDGATVTRLPERDAVGKGTFRGFLAFVAELLRSIFRPLKPLRSNVGADYSGGNRTRHVFLPATRLDHWRQAREHTGLSTNDLLAGALCAALTRWSARRGHPAGEHNLFMPIDVRPRDRAFDSFANHLSSIQLRWRGRTDANPLSLARELHAAAEPMLAARLPWLRAPFDGLLMRLSPIHVLRKALLDTRKLLTNYSFSNLIPLGVPGAQADQRWHFGEAVVERLLITTPCTPPQAANTTVIRYGDSLCFNFNFKESALSAAEVDELAGAFLSCLDELDELLKTAPASPRG